MIAKQGPYGSPKPTLRQVYMYLSAMPYRTEERQSKTRAASIRATRLHERPTLRIGSDRRSEGGNNDVSVSKKAAVRTELGMDFGLQSPRGPNVSISGRGRQNGFRLPSSSFSPGIVPFQEFIIVVPPPFSGPDTEARYVRIKFGRKCA